MERTSKFEGHMATLSVDTTKLMTRLENGEVGERYRALLSSEVVRQYFQEKLVLHVQKLAEPVEDEALKYTFSEENLWEYVKGTFSIVVFQNAVMDWIENGGVLEEYLLTNLTEARIKVTIEKAVKVCTLFIQELLEAKKTVREFIQFMEGVYSKEDDKRKATLN